MSFSNIEILDSIINGMELGVVVLDSGKNVTYWNQFMTRHSGIKPDEIIGRNIFEVFDYIPRPWLELKIDSVRLIRNFSFLSWKQKPHLFKFHHNRPITGDALEYMYQDCTLLPIKSEEASEIQVCITIQDVTDLALARKKMEEVVELNKKLEELTNFDGLTAVYNRRYVEKRIEQEFNKAKQNGSVFSIVLIDIDHFKKVNDLYGHLAGDEVLKEFAKIIKSNLRAPDVFGRYGGEEFFALLPDTNEEEAGELGLSLKNAVEEAVVETKGKKIKVTFSGGVVQYREHETDYVQMIHEADQALYHSKESGRNRISKFGTGGCCVEY